jgi:secreted trypsin-like serine protease
LAKTTLRPPVNKVSTTTQKSAFNFDISNLTNLISTILHPVSDNKPIGAAGTQHHSQQLPKCVAKKGTHIMERVLFREDYEDDDFAGETRFAEYPWMLELLKYNTKTREYEYRCGAVLLNSNTALTANHCLKSKVASNFKIRAGEWNRNSTIEYLPHQDRTLSKIISHENYYSGGLHNDIAILKWNTPLTHDIHIRPICLPEDNQSIAPGTVCTAIGFGSASENSPISDILKFVKVPIVEHKMCEQRFQNFRLGNRFKLHESFICAGGEQGFDTCKNDGGSPLICKQDNEESYYLAGLVSFGLGCGIKDIPGAYTNIFHLSKWIKNNIDK